jgi:hypothetical protein
VEQDRELGFTGLLSLGREDPKWSSTTGSPYKIVALSPNLIIVYPHYGNASGLVRVECVGTRRLYEDEKVFKTLKGNFEEALIHYGKYFLYLRTAGGEEKAMEEFKEFLRLAGMTDELRWHKKMMWELGLLGEGE